MSTEQKHVEQAKITYGNDASTRFLKAIKGNSVIVRQDTGVEYVGVLGAIDQFLNVVLHDAKEMYNGKEVEQLGEVFLRGSIVNYIALA